MYPSLTSSLIVNRYNHRPGFPRSSKDVRAMMIEFAADAYEQVRAYMLNVMEEMEACTCRSQPLHYDEDEAIRIVLKAFKRMRPWASDYSDWVLNTRLININWVRARTQQLQQDQSRE